MSRTTALVDRESVRDYQLAQARPSNSTKAATLYSFYIYNTKTKKIEQAFGFDIPPQSTQLSEQAAVDVVPLQEGNFWLDERGQYFKDVQLSGTFGYRPTRGQGRGQDFANVRRSVEQVQSSLSAFSGDTTLSVPKNERTGMDRYIDLHNIIRYYWNLKQKRRSAPDYIFVYSNWKMGESYQCTPLTFARSRQVPSDRFKVRWQMSLRLLRPMNIFAPPSDFLKKPNSSGGLLGAFKRIQDLTNLIDALSNVISTATSETLGWLNETVGNALETVDALVNAARLGPQLASQVGGFLSQGLRSAHRSFLNTSLLLVDAIKVGDVYAGLERQFLQLEELTKNLYPDLIEQFDRRDVIEVWQQADNRYNRYPFLPDPLAEDRFKVPKAPWTSRRDAAQGPPPEGTKTITLPQSITIKQLARTHLGDVSRWRDIVYLNRLQPPYFSPSGNGVSVLRPGIDPILLPSPVDEEENNVYSTQTESEKEALLYGRDLQVDLVTGDLLIDANGDLAVVEGQSNLVQAATLKVKHKTGSLALHPWYGLDIEVGVGVDLDTRAKAQLQVQRTFTSDPRIEEVQNLVVQIYGDVAQVQATLRPKSTDDSVQLQLQATRSE